jgi:hypothetical protein
LIVKTSCRSTDVGSNGRTGLVLTVNASTSAYSGKELRGYDSNTVGSTTSSTANIDPIRIPSSGATANTFGNAEIYFSNYASSAYKSVSIDEVSENNSSSFWYLSIAGDLWSNTTAINQITLTAYSGNFAQYSTASLYGIKKD